MPAAAAIIPAVAAIGGAVMKHRAQGKAAKQQAANAQSMQDYERQQGLRQVNEYNTNRTSSVQRHRDLLKSMIMSKGWGGSKVWDQLGGMDAYFSRPIGGLKSAAEFDPSNAAPQAQTGAGGGWNLFGDALGTAGKAYSAYKQQQAGEEGQQQNAWGNALGAFGGDTAKASDFLKKLKAGNPNG